MRPLDYGIARKTYELFADSDYRSNLQITAVQLSRPGLINNINILMATNYLPCILRVNKVST